MRSIDGIRSSKFGRALRKKLEEYPVGFELALILSVLLVVTIVWISSFLQNNPIIVPAAASVNLTLPTTTTQPKIGLPDRILAPSIHLDAHIEQVGLTKRGAMAVPADTNNAGWYQYGPKPGETGNAVLTGHVDTIWLKPAVFANIGNFKPGDNFIITDENGISYTFQVQQVTNYNLNNLPLNDIFGPSKDKNLNLITCSGTWSWKIASYTERTVVYTKLVSSTPK